MSIVMTILLIILGILLLAFIIISCFSFTDKFIPIQYIMVNEKFVDKVNTKIENWLLQYCINHNIPVAYQLTPIISSNGNECSGIVDVISSYNKQTKNYHTSRIEKLLIQYRKEKASTDYNEWLVLSHEIGHTLIHPIGEIYIQQEEEILADQFGGKLVIDTMSLSKLEMFSINSFLRIFCKLEIPNVEQQWKLFTRKEKKEMYKEYMEWKKENNDENKIEAKESN